MKDSEAFIFHGFGGYPGENWFPWLKTELEDRGYKVFVPQFPTPEGQSLEAWLEVVGSKKDEIDNKTILVAHSLGGIFLLRLLEKLEKPAKAAFFVGTPIGVAPIKNMDNDRKFSGSFDFDWEKIKQNAPHIVVFHSDNDPYVALGNGQELAKNLGVDLTFIPNAGHFNAAAGFTKFERLLNEILKLDEG